MVLVGKFRVSDAWSGVSADGTKPRASATLNDTQDGGQVKITFPEGKLPGEFALDSLVENIRVKPAITKYGMMLSYQGLIKGGK